MKRRTFIDIVSVKQRLRIADVLSSAGIDPPAHRRIACPIHGGKNPSAFSFTVERFCCWSCGAHGDVVDLAAALNGLDFRAALEFCAALAGVEPSESRPRRDSPEVLQRAAELAARADIEQDFARRWHDLIAAHDDAEADCFVVAVARRRDPDAREPLTRDILTSYSDAERRRAELEAKLDELEQEWRAWRASRWPTVKRPPAGPVRPGEVHAIGREGVRRAAA